MAAIRNTINSKSTNIFLLISLLFVIYPSLCTSQANNTFIDELSFTSTLFDDEPIPSDSISMPIYWLFAMVISGIIGTGLIPIIFIHTYYHWFKQEITGTLSRILYIIFFTSYWIVCISYAFLRTDLIFPMGHGIDCKIGFFLSTNGVFLSKLTLFIIFLVRIDLAFHSSALGYPRKCLFVLMSIYTVVICALNTLYMIVTWNIVSFASIDYDFSNNMKMGICTTAHKVTSQWKMILTLMGTGDLIFSLIVCGLFVYKLNKVIQMTATGDNDKFSVKPSRQDTKRENKLSQIMRKQTVLVIFAITTSELILIGGAMYAPLSYTIPVDASVNVCAVWLMFNFADNIWNKCIKYCCCCCYCCIKKEQFLMSLESISRKISIRSRGSSAVPMPSNSSFSNRDKYPSARSNDSANLPTIAERKSEKIDDIVIKFDNEWKSDDLPPNRPSNLKKDYMPHSGTKQLKIDTTGSNNIELVYDKSDSNDKSREQERVGNESPVSNPDPDKPSHTKSALSAVSSNSDSEPEPDDVDINITQNIPQNIPNIPSYGNLATTSDRPPVTNQKSASIPTLNWGDSPHSTAL